MANKNCEACFGTGRCSIERLSNEFSQTTCRVCGGSGVVFAPDPPSPNPVRQKKTRPRKVNSPSVSQATGKKKSEFNTWLTVIAFFLIFAYIRNYELMANGPNFAVSLFASYFVGAFYKVILVILFIVIIIAAVTAGGA
jgi:hypothetical protein